MSIRLMLYWSSILSSQARPWERRAYNVLNAIRAKCQMIMISYCNIIAHMNLHLSSKSTRGSERLGNLLAPSTGSRPLRKSQISISKNQELQQYTQAGQGKPTSQGSYTAWGMPRKDVMKFIYKGQTARTSLPIKV